MHPLDESAAAVFDVVPLQLACAISLRNSEDRGPSVRNQEPELEVVSRRNDSLGIGLHSAVQQVAGTMFLGPPEVLRV
jgi:hypothetical protein